MLNISKIVLHIFLLYCFYRLGKWIQIFFDLSIPGSIIGMLLLFILLLTGLVKIEWVDKGAQFMVDHLVLFFIPATVGVIDYFSLFTGKGILLIVIVLISSMLVILTSGLVTQFFALRKDKTC